MLNINFGYTIKLCLRVSLGVTVMSLPCDLKVIGSNPVDYHPNRSYFSKLATNLAERGGKKKSSH